MKKKQYTHILFVTMLVLFSFSELFFLFNKFSDKSALDSPCWSNLFNFCRAGFLGGGE